MTMALTAAFDNAEAQICMTLAAIAYSSENDPSGIQVAIQDNLANSDFATKGNWKLAWGPGLAEDDENLVYVAQDTTQPASYAVVVRGTDWCFPVNFVEDFDVFHQSHPGFGPAGVLVSNGALDGLTDITGAVSGGTTFIEFLENQYNAGGFDTFDVFVTGHSLGGCLASITFPWLVGKATSTWSSSDLLNVKAYTFAAPTAGNSGFASYVTGLANGGPYYYWSVVNPRDLPPYCWANMIEVLPGEVVVPMKVGVGLLELFSLMAVVLTALARAKVSYEQPGSTNRYVLTNNLDFSSNCGPPPVTTAGQYFCWVGEEHKTDNYLQLLGAPQTGIAYNPTCPALVAPPGEDAAEAQPIADQMLALWKERH
jgi:hypothetical protein